MFTYRLTYNIVITGMVHDEIHGQAIQKMRFNRLIINGDPTVRADMEQHFLRTVPEDAPCQHDYEGGDDMPAHIKSSLLSTSLMLPVSHGHLLLGT